MYTWNTTELTGPRADSKVVHGQANCLFWGPDLHCFSVCIYIPCSNPHSALYITMLYQCLHISWSVLVKPLKITQSVTLKWKSLGLFSHNALEDELKRYLEGSKHLWNTHEVFWLLVSGQKPCLFTRFINSNNSEFYFQTRLPCL